MRIILHRETLDFGRQCHIFENYRAEKGRNNEVRKGSIYNPTIILCAQPFKEFVKDGTIPPAEKAKSELYVAITRVRYSVRNIQARGNRPDSKRNISKSCKTASEKYSTLVSINIQSDKILFSPELIEHMKDQAEDHLLIHEALTNIFP